jgi:hypothetical protein
MVIHRVVNASYEMDIRTALPLTRHTRFQVFMAASMKMAAFLDVELCSLIEADQHFRNAYCLHHQGNSYIASNIGLLHRDYMAIYPRQLSSSIRHITVKENYSSFKQHM